VELDRISMALSDMKDIAIRMNEEMKYHEQIIDELVVVSIFNSIGVVEVLMVHRIRKMHPLDFVVI